ncbi:MAG: hypothetical protein FWD59_04055 [Micrococcales bacterium]|nr:hypothetical protein [Micrococcales bacterium]
MAGNMNDDEMTRGAASSPVRDASQSISSAVEKGMVFTQPRSWPSRSLGKRGTSSYDDGRRAGSLASVLPSRLARCSAPSRIVGSCVPTLTYIRKHPTADKTSIG